MSNTSENKEAIIIETHLSTDINTKDLTNEKAKLSDLINLGPNKAAEELLKKYDVRKYFQCTSFALECNGENYCFGVLSYDMSKQFLELCCTYFNLYNNPFNNGTSFNYCEVPGSWHVVLNSGGSVYQYIFCLDKKTFAEKFLSLFPEHVAKFYAEKIGYK